MKPIKICIVLLFAACVLTGCSDVRMNAAYQQKTLDVQTVVCQATTDTEVSAAFTSAQTYWQDVYSASKAPWPFGKVYLSASRSEWVATHLGEINVDCRDIANKVYTADQQKELLAEECAVIKGIANAANGMKGGE